MSPAITTLTERARRLTAGRRRRRLPAAAARGLGAMLAVALVAAGMQAAGAAPASAAALAPAAGAKGGAPGPVSNAFAMGGGIGGSVDPRTGAFQAQLPLVNVAGRAGTGLSLALSYSQSLAAQGGAAANRFGLGAGWSLGMPWVDTGGGVHVYPASGGSYAYDTGSPTGLAQYPLRDLRFAKDPGTIPARPGVPAQPYVYTLTYLDGTTDRFDASGNLVEQADRFGNPIDLTWKQSGQLWQPVTVTDSYGQVYRFDYSQPGQVSVISPPDAGKIAATVTLHISNGLLDTVTDPLHQQTRFSYSQVPGLSFQVQLLSTVVSPTGETTGVRYLPLSYEPGVVVADTVTVTNPAGAQVLAPLHFNIDPSDNAGRHNYTGYPNHVKTGTDGLFTSGDFGYRYTTSLSNGTSSVESTYNSLHLLMSRTVKIAAAGGTALNQKQTYAYPLVTSVTSLPPNYAKPTSVTTVYGDPVFGATRTVTTKSSYDDRGQQTSFTNAAGTTTATTYDPRYGLPLTQTVTGADGAASITANTLTADGKSVHQATTAVGTGAGGKVTGTARTVASYDYNGFGQVTGETVAWAPGAKPAGDSGGPDQITDTRQISTDTAAHTQTDVVTAAAGTPQAASTTTVTDLVTGQVLTRTTPDKLTTTYTYDVLGRPLTVTAPGGLTTRTVYPSPTVTTVTAPSGLVTQTTTDVVGRTVKVTDNVSGQKLVAGDPAARTVQTDSYAPDGSKLTTTTPAGTTTTSFDPLGRPVSVIHPGGITQTDKYNDVKNTQTLSLLPAGAQPAPASVTTEGYNNLNQPVSSSTSYPDGTPQAPAAEAYDGLGRVTTYSADNVTAAPSYAGAGGLQTGATLTPTDTTGFPGTPVTAGTGNTMTGALTTKTLTSPAETGPRNTAAAAPATGTSYTYNAAGQVATATDPAGHATRYTYTAAGQVATITQPDGAVTTYSYDKDTGQLTGTTTRGTDGTVQAAGYTYYPATGRVKSVYDPARPGDAISYDYDADGHVTAVHYPDGTSTAATYTDAGKLATITDITGAVTSYTYNTDGGCGPVATDLCAAVQKRGDATLASVAYSYDALDRVHTITRGNKVTTTLAYTDASQVKTETVTAADGTVLRADSYTYDGHGNVDTHTITTALPAPAPPGTAAPGRAAARGPRRAAAATTTTASYHYDAYNRLVSSAVYPSAAAAGTPDTATSYTVNTAGDVTGQATTAGGKTVTIVNTIDRGQLTSRTINGGTAVKQAFGTDGNVTTDLAGNSYAPTLAGQIASVKTPAGITTRYAYWPDGTRRSATTTAGGADHTITYHYTTAGKIADETYAGGGPATVTASYLITLNREARTLLATTGTAPATIQATGPGTGYYLTDAHGSVTAMIDAGGQVTASYAYGDYGQPIGASPALLPTPAASPAGNAAVNPFGYDGAYTNPATGTQYLPARTYDPAQGRFLSLDAADQLNRYQAFATNPITNTDPTGQWAIPQILTDAFAAALFIACAFISAGAAAPVLAAVVTGAEEAATAITASVVFNAVSAVTNIGAAATSATLMANDAAELAGHGFLSDTDKENLTTANTILGIVGTAAGVGAGVADSLAHGAETAASSGTVAESEWGDVPSMTDLTANLKPLPAPGTAADVAVPAAAPGEAFAGGTTLSPQEAGSLTKMRALYDEPAADSSEWGDMPEVHVGPGSGNELAPPVTPTGPDPAAPQVADLQQKLGQDANLNPATEPPTQAEKVPSIPDLPIAPASPIADQGTDNSIAQGVNPLVKASTTGIQQTLDGDTASTAPQQPPNPLNSNVSPPTIGVEVFQPGPQGWVMPANQPNPYGLIITGF